MDGSKICYKPIILPEHEDGTHDFINWDTRGYTHHSDVSQNHLDIIEVRRIGPKSVLLKWKPNQNLRVDGYEICSDGETLNRVFNASRCLSVIDNIQRSPTTLEVFALHNGARYEPPSIVQFSMD